LNPVWYLFVILLFVIFCCNGITLVWWECHTWSSIFLRFYLFCDAWSKM